MATTVTDDRTANLNLPLPHADNALKDDIARLRDALTGIDTASVNKADLVGGKVPAIQLPSFVDDVVEAANFASLPTTGETGKIYVTLNDSKPYRWSGSAYVVITASPGSSDDIVEGSANLYFTSARAQAAIPPATPSTAGKVKVGAGLTVGGDGTLSVAGGGGGGLPVFTDEIIVPGGSTTTLTPSANYVPGQIELFFNGSLVYGNGDDYTASNGTTITLNFTATPSDTFLLKRWAYLPESRALNKAGDTMTGSLGLAGNATVPLEAVPKQQLDAGLANKADAAATAAAISAANTAIAAKADIVGGKVPASQLPSYVDDVLEAANFAALPGTGETGKIYVTLDDNKTYRWSGAAYIQVGGGAAVTSFNGRTGAVSLTEADVVGSKTFAAGSVVLPGPAGTIVGSTVGWGGVEVLNFQVMLSGTFSFVFGLASNGGNVANYRLYKNGVSIGVLHSNPYTTYSYFTDNIAVLAGDTIQAFAYTDQQSETAKVIFSAIKANQKSNLLAITQIPVGAR